MLHCPVVQLFKCVPVIAKICETIHKQTISGRSSERIYNINLTLRVAFFQCLLCNHGGIDNAGNAGWERYLQNIFALFQKRLKIMFKFIGIYLRSLCGSTVLQGKIELIKRYGFSKIIFIFFAVQFVMKTYIRNITAVKMFFCKICCRAATENKIIHMHEPLCFVEFYLLFIVTLFS